MYREFDGVQFLFETLPSKVSFARGISEKPNFKGSNPKIRISAGGGDRVLHLKLSDAVLRTSAPKLMLVSKNVRLIFRPLHYKDNCYAKNTTLRFPYLGRTRFVLSIILIIYLSFLFFENPRTDFESIRSNDHI